MLEDYDADDWPMFTTTDDEPETPSSATLEAANALSKLSTELLRTQPELAWFLDGMSDALYDFEPWLSISPSHAHYMRGYHTIKPVM